VVIRTPFGGGIRGGHYHSQSPEAHFIHTPGLKVVAPSNPVDAKGLLLSCLRQNDPVLFMEPKRVYRAARGDVPEGDYTIPLEKAAVLRAGDQVSLISYGAMVHECKQTAELAAQQGISVEVIDLRTLLPFDIETLIASVKKTGRAVIVHEAPKTCGFGAELVASIQERAMAHLEAPILRVAGLDTPFPYTLEHEYMPTPDRILGTVRKTLEW
jgi:2-oxoisovalerate dehydrogenase E1 component beta subunit